MTTVTMRFSPATGYRLPATGYRLPATGYRLPATGYRLPATGYRLPATGCRGYQLPRLPATGYRLPATGYRLPATGYRLPATGYRLPATGYRLPAAAANPKDFLWCGASIRLPQCVNYFVAMRQLFCCNASIILLQCSIFAHKIDFLRPPPHLHNIFCKNQTCKRNSYTHHA